VGLDNTVNDLLHTSHTLTLNNGAAAVVTRLGPVSTRKHFPARAQLINKITTSKIWEIIPHLTYRKIMYAEYIKCVISIVNSMVESVKWRL